MLHISDGCMHLESENKNIILTNALFRYHLTFSKEEENQNTTMFVLKIKCKYLQYFLQALIKGKISMFSIRLLADAYRETVKGTKSEFQSIAALVIINVRARFVVRIM